MNNLIFVAVAFVLAIGQADAGGRENHRPNIVVFLADDLGWADCSLYGGKDMPTPNMARLAQCGMTLTHAFVASPSCAPSRAALLTSLDPMRNGAMLNHARPRADIYFQQVGPACRAGLVVDSISNCGGITVPPGRRDLLLLVVDSISNCGGITVPPGRRDLLGGT